MYLESTIPYQIKSITDEYSRSQLLHDKSLSRGIKGKKIGEIPVGAVIVNKDGDIVATGYNQTICSNDSSAHAEIVALRALGQRVSNYRFPDYSIYVTLEPCCMCAMALIHARLKNLYFGAYDLKTGACGSAFNLISDPKHNHKIIVEGGILKKSVLLYSQTF